jgi:hypothetical protein
VHLESHPVAAQFTGLINDRSLFVAFAAHRIPAGLVLGRKHGAAAAAYRHRVLDALQGAALAQPVAQGIGHEVQDGGLLEVGDGEDGLEGRLDPYVLAVFRKLVDLQKSLVGSLLNFKQVRDFDRAENPGETDPLHILINCLHTHPSIFLFFARQ